MNYQLELTAVLAVVIVAKQHYLHVSFAFYKGEAEVEEYTQMSDVYSLVLRY